MIIHDLDQYSSDWLAIRAGLPTASSADKLITSTGNPSKQIKDYAAQLAADKFAGRTLDVWEGNSATQRGHDLEQQARDYFQMITDIEVKEVGFVTDSLMRVGCSPDGMLPDGNILEIKNLTAKKHVQALAYYNKYGRQLTTNVSQVQFQMMVCEASKAFLLYHHPDLPSLIITVASKEPFHLALKGQITDCLALRDEYINTMEELS